MIVFVKPVLISRLQTMSVFGICEVTEGLTHVSNVITVLINLASFQRIICSLVHFLI